MGRQTSTQARSMKRPLHVRDNARLWLFVILPRVRVHLMVYTCWLLTPKRDRT